MAFTNEQMMDALSKDGIVKEVCVEDGQPVEFGQRLVILK